MKKLLSLLLALMTLLQLTAMPISAEEEASLPTLTVDMSNKTHQVVHGAAGFLYGISNEGVPSTNTLTPLKPKVLATKGALGTEHPYGDALDVADEFFEGGGEMVMMYNSNYYGVFGVTAAAEDYAEVLRTVIAPYVAEWKDSMREKYPDIDKMLVYIPINEGTPATLADGSYNFNKAWELYYHAIVDGEREYYEKNGKYPPETYEKTAYIAGHNDANARSYDDMFKYLLFCKNHDCLPDVVTWHELDTVDLRDMEYHIADYRTICKELKIEEKQVVCNEYAQPYECGIPGRLVNWIGRFEDNEIYGCLPFWHQANNLNDLAANDNAGNGAWWVYKWYGDMSGMALDVKTNTEYDALYGVATIDEDKKSATVLTGGIDGNARVVLESIGETETFAGADRVHISVEGVYYKGYHGEVNAPETVYDGVYPVKDGKVEINLTDMAFSDAYKIVVSQTEEDLSIPVTGRFRKKYEAEQAKLLGEVTIEKVTASTHSYYVSGNYRVNNIRYEGDGVEYTVQVPTDGRYKLEFLYTNGVGTDTGNRNHYPKNLSMELSIDGKTQRIDFASTLHRDMGGCSYVYADLKAGSHTVTLTYDGKEKIYYPEEDVIVTFCQDALFITYDGVYGEDVLYTSKLEAEQADFLVSLSPELATYTDMSGYTGGGYVNGLTDKASLRHTVSVENSGLYTISVKYHSDKSGSIYLFKDNTALTYTNALTTLDIAPSDGWATVSTTAYFAKGLNIIDIGADSGVSIDYTKITYAGDDSITVEAEDFAGEYKTAKSKFSGVTYVSEIEAKEKGIEIEVDAPEAGIYAMQVFQSNDRLCGTHYYNIKIIDKYINISVNGGEDTRYFFPNTFSRDSFKEKTVLVELKEGKNTLRLFNDDSWEVYYGGTTGTPGTDRMTNTTPNLDKFIFTKLISNKVSADNRYTATVLATDGGRIIADKNSVERGESITLTVIPEKSAVGVVSELEALYINGEKVSVKDNGDGTYSYTVSNMSEDISVKGYFDIDGWLSAQLSKAQERLTVYYVYTDETVEELKAAIATAKSADDRSCYQAYFGLVKAMDGLEIVSDNLFADSLVDHWSFEDGYIGVNGNELIPVTTELKAGFTTLLKSDEGHIGKGVKLSGDSGFKIGDVGNEFTVSIWAKLSSRGPANASLFFKNNGDMHDQNYVAIGVQDGIGRVRIHNNKDILWHNTIWSHQWIMDNWHHMAYTEKGGVGCLYIDGKKVDIGLVLTKEEAAELFLGVAYWTDSCVNGLIDELYLYNAQLTDEQILTLSQGVLPEVAPYNKNALGVQIEKTSYCDVEAVEGASEAYNEAIKVYKSKEATQQEIDSATDKLASFEDMLGIAPIDTGSDESGIVLIAIISAAAAIAVISVIAVSKKKKK